MNLTPDKAAEILEGYQITREILQYLCAIYLIPGLIALGTCFLILLSLLLHGEEDWEAGGKQLGKNPAGREVGRE